MTDAIMFTVLVGALVLQLRTRRYTPWIYWLCVVLVSIVGTQLTDFCTDTLGVSLYVSTGVFAVILAAVFFMWYRQERTLAIASINTPRREAFYWAAILTTFALGTAAGDLATEALDLGFRNGALIFGGLILATWIASRLGAGPVLTFWVAYVLTRPLGASLGDLLTQDRDLGGLALGASVTSLVFLTAIVVLVVREQLLAGRGGDDGPGADRSAGADRGAGAVRSDDGRRDDAEGAGDAHGLGAAQDFGDVQDPGRGQSVAGGQSGQSVGGGQSVGAGRGARRGQRRDAAWAGAAVAGVAAAALVLSLTHGSQPTTAVAGQPHPTTRLGDLGRFAVIVTDVQSDVAQNDLAAAKTRVKDLEVAWDDAEGGLKPRDATKWHQLDDQIDAALTALRSAHPTQAGCAGAVSKLLNTLNAFDGVSRRAGTG